MGKIYSSSDFVSSEAAPQSQTTPGAPAPVGVSRRVYSSAELGDNDFLPSYANGLSPETAINVSPISVEDRARLSVGNESGKIKFLRENYGAVIRSKSGDLLVQDKVSKLWHQVDPSGLGDGNPWEKTKELVKDVTELAPMATKIGAQLGAAAGLAAVTGGTSLAAQAGTSAAVGAALSAGETSLGRLVGTYEATPEEQLKDVAIETMLNFGGTYVAAGVKPGISMIANGLRKGAKAIRNAMPEAVKSVIGALSGAGTRSVNTLLRNPDEVTAAMKAAGVGAQSSDDVVNNLVSDSIGKVAHIARQLRGALSNMYDSMSKQVIQTVDDGFQPGFKELQAKLEAQLVSMGAGRINPNGAFQAYTQQELRQLAKETGQVSEFLMDKGSREVIDDLVNELRVLGSIKEASGPAGAAQVIRFNKVFGDLTRRLKESADDQALAPAQRALGSVKSAFDEHVMKRFDLAKPVVDAHTGQLSSNLYNSLNEVYHKTMTETSFLSRAVYQANRQGSYQPYEAAYKQLISKSGSNVTAKTSFDSALDVISKYGGDQGQAVVNMGHVIKINDSAKSWIPFTRPGALSQALSMGGIAGAVTGSPAAVVIGAGTAAATSPRMLKSLVTSSMAAKNFVSKLTPMQLKQMSSSPELLGKWAETIVQAPAFAESTKQSLIDYGMKQVRGE